MSDEWIPDDPGNAALHAELGALLRAGGPSAPPRVERRALGRIRVEREGLLIARTLGGALVRVVAALPAYLTRGVSDPLSYSRSIRHTPGETHMTQTPRGSEDS